jgi:hypothetical protein
MERLLDFIFIRNAPALAKTDQSQPDRSCDREGTLNRMTPVQMRMSRAQPKAADCISDAATNNSYLREWQAKPATEYFMFSYESDSSCPNRRAERLIRTCVIHEAPKQQTNNDSLCSYFLNSDYSDEYYSDYDDYSSSDPDLDYIDTFYAIINTGRAAVASCVGCKCVATDS